MLGQWKMIPKQALLSLAITGILLTLTVASVFIEPMNQRQPRLENLIDKLIPYNSNDLWSVRKIEIASTEQQVEGVRSILKFDDYRYFEYTTKDAKLYVYLAYWKPGKPARVLVAQHTPDICWPNSGATLLEEISNIQPTLGSQTLMPAEWRKFRMSDGSIHEVLYWHILGSRPIVFKTSGILDWIRSVIDEARRARAEQIFIRISSPEQLAKILNNPSVVEMFQILANEVLGEASEIKDP